MKEGGKKQKDKRNGQQRQVYKLQICMFIYFRLHQQNVNFSELGSYLLELRLDPWGLTEHSAVGL